LRVVEQLLEIAARGGLAGFEQQIDERQRDQRRLLPRAAATKSPRRSPRVASGRRASSAASRTLTLGSSSSRVKSAAATCSR
jgi:hypothetical protein